jgi:hypothetical protein
MRDVAAVEEAHGIAHGAIVLAAGRHRFSLVAVLLTVSMVNS